jgi:hypothetical protein
MFILSNFISVYSAPRAKRVVIFFISPARPAGWGLKLMNRLGEKQ